MNGKVNPKVDTIKVFFSKIRSLSSIFKKGRGDLPSLSPSCASVSVAEYASISPNMLKHPWKCLNKLFWLCQGSEYAWSSYMLDRLLKIPRVLNKPGLSIFSLILCQVLQCWLLFLGLRHALYGDSPLTPLRVRVT